MVGQNVDSLRWMVVHFVACVMEKVAMDAGFLALLEEASWKQWSREQ